MSLPNCQASEGMVVVAMLPNRVIGGNGELKTSLNRAVDKTLRKREGGREEERERERERERRREEGKVSYTYNVIHISSLLHYHLLSTVSGQAEQLQLNSSQKSPQNAQPSFPLIPPIHKIRQYPPISTED